MPDDRKPKKDIKPIPKTEVVEKQPRSGTVKPVAPKILQNNQDGVYDAIPTAIEVVAPEEKAVFIKPDGTATVASVDGEESIVIEPEQQQPKQPFLHTVVDEKATSRQTQRRPVTRIGTRSKYGTKHSINRNSAEGMAELFESSTPKWVWPSLIVAFIAVFIVGFLAWSATQEKASLQRKLEGYEKQEIESIKQEDTELGKQKKQFEETQERLAKSQTRVKELEDKENSNSQAIKRKDSQLQEFQKQLTEKNGDIEKLEAQKPNVKIAGALFSIVTRDEVKLVGCSALHRGLFMMELCVDDAESFVSTPARGDEKNFLVIKAKDMEELKGVLRDKKKQFNEAGWFALTSASIKDNTPQRKAYEEVIGLIAKWKLSSANEDSQDIMEDPANQKILLKNLDIIGGDLLISNMVWALLCTRALREIWILENPDKGN